MADGGMARDRAPWTTDAPGVRWRAALLARRPVVDVYRVEHMGVVEDLVFDPQRSQVVGLIIRPTGDDGSVLGAARRAFGMANGLRYVEAAKVVALKDDVVTVDPA